MSRLLGTNGVWVDHLTTLDPHPLNNDGFFDFPYTEVDAPAQTYENVLFHDNYYQTLNVFFYGEAVAGAYVRELTALSGGYGGFAASHSDVHLWYHGTVDLRVPADDSLATIGSAERLTWWTPDESYGVTSGFYYSLIGGGDRLSEEQPAGPGTAQIRDGYNQWWDFGAGTSDNRIALPANNGNWPNLIRFNLAGTNLMAHGQSNAVTVYAQWAKPASSNAIVSIYLDDDLNPFNGNEHLLRQLVTSGNGANQISFGTVSINVNATNAAPGVHSLYARITGGGPTRHLYAPELLTVFSSFQPPRLAIARDAGPRLRLDVNGVSGQRVVVQTSPDRQIWQPLMTNWLATNRWSYFESGAGIANRFYRATVQ